MSLLKTCTDLLPGTIYRHRIRRDDKFSPRVVTTKSDFVIDGFPRSANTSVYYKIQLSFPDLVIAHHIHSWQQFLFAKILRKHSCLLLRKPDASISSLNTKFSGMSVSLCYFNYIVLNMLSLFFVDEILCFEDVTKNERMEIYMERLAKQYKKKPRSYEMDEYEELMKIRTEFKNKKTDPIDFDSLNYVARFMRNMANYVYKIASSSNKIWTL